MRVSETNIGGRDSARAFLNPIFDGWGRADSKDAGANMHALMTIAHTLWQLLHTGYLKRLGRRMRKVQQINWAALVAQAMELGSFTAEELSAAVGARRMRFLLE